MTHSSSIEPSANPGWTPSIAAGFLAGALGGVLFLTVGLIRNGVDVLAYWPTPSYAIWLLLRSEGLYSLCFGAAGALLGGLILPRFRRQTFALVCGIMVAATVAANLAAWWQIDVLAGLPFADPTRWRAAGVHGVAAIAAGALSSALLLRMQRQSRSTDGTRRRAALVCLVALALIGIGDLGLNVASPGSGESPFTADKPRQVVVIGLDGMTFRVLSPLLRAGELPTIRRFIEEGAWGTFMTYGTASSPRVWTSMATGKRVRDHGIDDFVKARGNGYRASPMRSTDRRSRAVWNILSDFDLKVALIDWLITYPPEEVNGYVVSRLKLRAKNRTFPPELDSELANLWSPRPTDRRQRRFWDIDRVFTSARALLEKEPIDFLAIFDATIDEVQHHSWRDYEPTKFSGASWGEPPEVSDPTLIPDVYQNLDRKLSELEKYLDKDALVIVVSDHGQRAASHPRVRLRLDRILEALGYSQLEQRRGKDHVLYAESRAYTLVETPWTPVLRVNLNLENREPRGIVPLREAPTLAEKLATDLAAVRFVDGAPLFGSIEKTIETTPGDTTGSDLNIALSRRARSAEAGDLEVVVGGKTTPLATFQSVDRSISGDHDHQGVFLARGPGIEPGPIGQRAVPTALHDLLWHLTDKVDMVDSVLPILRRLGFIDRASTLDLTPTVLYALGLPVAKDMAGRPLTEIFSQPRKVEWVDSYEDFDPREHLDQDAPSDDELLEHLRSLGYVTGP